MRHAGSDTYMNKLQIQLKTFSVASKETVEKI